MTIKARNNMFAKKQESVVSSEFYELFVTETVKDIDGNDVEIPRSIGQYSLAQLNQEKTNYETAIVKVEEKISVIEALQVLE